MNTQAPYLKTPWFRVLRDPLLPEHLLAKLWRTKSGRSLRTTDGRSLRVIYPGRPAPGHGPDFRDAVLEIDGARVSGPVELHRTTSGWYAHGHHKDPAFDNVVLHVVAKQANNRRNSRRDRAIVITAETANPETLTTVELDDSRHSTGASTLLADLASLQDDELRNELRRAGILRFDMRVRELREEIERRGPDQAILTAMMDCLGYSENRRPFAELAGRLPFPLLRAVAGTAHGSAIGLVRDLLVSGAGLAPPSNAWRSLIGTGPMPSSAWRVSGVRPSNRPLPRLFGLASYLTDALEPGVTKWLSDALTQGSEALIERLTVREGTSTYVGDSRAREIAVNAVLPGLTANALANDDVPLATSIRKAYQTFPALQENTLTREAKALLGSRAPKGLCACEQQGLIQIYRDAVATAAHPDSRHVNEPEDA